MDYEIKIEVNGHKAFVSISGQILTINPVLAEKALAALKNTIPYLEAAATTYEQNKKTS